MKAGAALRSFIGWQYVVFRWLQRNQRIGLGMPMRRNEWHSILSRMLFWGGGAVAVYVSWAAILLRFIGGVPIHLASFQEWRYDPYLPAIVYLPCFGVAFLRNKWSIVPFWFVGCWASVYPSFGITFSNSKDIFPHGLTYPLGIFGQNRMLEFILLLMPPMAVQISKALKKKPIDESGGLVLQTKEQ